jgi:hypothetical protein
MTEGAGSQQASSDHCGAGQPELVNQASQSPFTVARARTVGISQALPGNSQRIMQD